MSSITKVTPFLRANHGIKSIKILGSIGAYGVAIIHRVVGIISKEDDFQSSKLRIENSKTAGCRWIFQNDRDCNNILQKFWHNLESWIQIYMSYNRHLTYQISIAFENLGWYFHIHVCQWQPKKFSALQHECKEKWAKNAREYSDGYKLVKCRAKKIAAGNSFYRPQRCLLLRKKSKCPVTFWLFCYILWRNVVQICVLANFYIHKRIWILHITD